MAANVVSPSNDFSNLSPRQISFRTGGLITAVIGIVSLPWKLYEDVGAYIFTWLVGYGSLLAGLRGRDDRRLLDPAEDEARTSPISTGLAPVRRYWFTNGFNVRALVAVAIGVVPVIPGFLNAATTKGGVVAEPTFLDQLYRYGVFVAFGLAAVSYFAMAQAVPRESTAAALAE